MTITIRQLNRTEAPVTSSFFASIGTVFFDDAGLSGSPQCPEGPVW